MTASAPSTTRQPLDVRAVVALVVAFVVPPLGILLAATGKQEGRRLSGLRVAAIAVGVMGTIFGILVGVMLFAGENATSR